MRTPQDVFIGHLKENGLSMTPQRALIVETFLEEEGYFSAEHLFGKVREMNSGVGQATVYRTMKLLVDSGLADAFDPGDGVMLYEHSYGHSHHDHLICETCGKKVEVRDDSIEARQEELAVQYGFEMTSHRMLLFGICPDCQAKMDCDSE
ncbi:MAG: Fur family transcriptional regulator [Desulfovibrio sp.]